MPSGFLTRRAGLASARQRRVRDRASRMCLAGAVRYAVQVFFRFEHRNANSKALWCESERVWLGRETFLSWALADGSIDVPWLVARALDAPPDPDRLYSAVREELVAYWTASLDELPRTSRPRWLPLP